MLVLAAGAVFAGVYFASSNSPSAPASSRKIVSRPAPKSPKHSLSAVEVRGVRNIRKLIPFGLPVYCGGRHGNELAFTFDDGPGPYTHYAVKKLAQAHERGTFFVVGTSMEAHPGWLPREQKVASIADHTFTHSDLLELAPAAVATELEQDKRMIERDSGRAVDLFRPPYGAQDPAVNQIAKRLGLLDIMWSYDSRDSLGANWAGIIKNVEADMRPGSIILMHENHGQTIRALTTLLPVLHRRHLRSVSIPELFATDPPSAAQVRRGLPACGAPTQPPAGAS
jgi:peptidoglycan/xylan/chitin deacetylase (PgdA/CDA1 family)